MLTLAKRCLGPLLLAAVYIAMAVIAFSIHDHQRFVMLMWAPIGIALGATLRWGIRLWPGVTIGALVAVIVNGFSVWVALWIAAVDTVEIVVAVLALRALAFRSTLPRVRDVFALLGVTIPIAMVGATISTAGVYAMGFLPVPLPEALSTWWFSHVPAFLIITPILLTIGRPRSHRRRRVGERSALLVGLFVVSAQTFGLLPPWLFGDDDVYVLMPFVVWAAVRFGPRGTSLANLVLAAMAIHAWTVGHGPFELVTDAQLFISTVSISSLVLAAYALERARVTKRKTAIFTAAFDAIITMDTDCKLVELNPAAERLFGLTRESVGAPLPERMIPRELCAPERTGSRTRYTAERADGSTFAAEASLTRMPLAGEEVVAAFVRDVTSEDEELRHQALMLRRAEELAHLGSFEADLGTGRVEWSDELYRIYGRDPATFTPTFDSFLASVYEADRERIRAEIDAALATHQPFLLEERIKRPDGTVRALVSRGQAFVDGDHVRVTGCCQDVTERKHAEDELRYSLHEKDVLLREIHHRVKNNLQVISSLLNLQLVKETAPLVRKSLTESQSRIQSMALVHRLLYQSNDLVLIDFAEYLGRLTTTLFEAYNVWPDRIRMHVSAAKIRLDIDRAIPCGLIVNEIVANALTHAFPDDRSGNVWLDVRQRDTKVDLLIRDDGIGIPVGIELTTTRSFGLQIARTLSQQLGGTLTLERDRGTAVRLTFPYAEEEFNDDGNIEAHRRSRTGLCAEDLRQ